MNHDWFELPTADHPAAEFVDDALVEMVRRGEWVSMRDAVYRKYDGGLSEGITGVYVLVRWATSGHVCLVRFDALQQLWFNVWTFGVYSG